MGEITAFSDLSTTMQVALGAMSFILAVFLIYTLLIWKRTPSERILFLPKWVWLVTIVISQPLGPALFLAAGRMPESADLRTTHSETTQRDVVDVLYGEKERQ